MKLRELLRTISDEEWLYIGASSGFVCIQKREGMEKELKAKSKYYLNMYRTQKRITEMRIKNHPSYMEKLNKALQAAEESNHSKKIKRCREDIVKAESIYKNALKNLERLTNILDGHKGFLDREVKDTYRKNGVEPFGTVIVVEGPETGPYWMLSEVEQNG